MQHQLIGHDAAKSAVTFREMRIKTELMNAIMGALDAHTAMSTQALNSPAVQNGMKDILLNHSHLWETLRDQAAGQRPLA